MPASQENKKQRLRLYQYMQNQFDLKQESSKQDYQRNLNYIRAQKKRLDELHIAKHEKDYMDHKFNSQLSRYHSDLKIVHDINQEQRR